MNCNLSNRIPEIHSSVGSSLSRPIGRVTAAVNELHATFKSSDGVNYHRTSLQQRVSPIPARAKSLMQNEVLKNLFRDTTYLLPHPTSEQNVAQCVKMDGETQVILWRGCNQQQVLRIALQGATAATGPNINTAAPTETAALKQVGEKSLGELVEFSTSSETASRFGRGAFIIAIAIQAKYLRKGSVSEGGWVANQAAPSTLIGWTVGQELIKVFQRSYPSQVPHCRKTNI